MDSGLSWTTSLDSSSPADEPGFAGGLSDPTTNQYRHRRHVFDIINNLHSAGLQSQFDLPQIAVVGSQSVGKSSLIESISGITLPRAKGTCTRCPIECRLSRVQTDWKCEVYLRLARQTTETPFGPLITDKSEVEERIRRAQLAILNPSMRVADFLASSPPLLISNEVSFSRDVISVRIQGRDVDDLSFIDLPGIIQSVRQGGNKADIQEVQELVKSFIVKPSCLILLVISCETDLENQGARTLTKEVDPSGKRTIPVLTKPDRIPVGEHSTWTRLLENQIEDFHHGWHCVKQSNQQQLDDGISWETARQNEIDFFDTTAPWSDLEEVLKSRLGTTFLTQSLGTILFELICKRLPGLIKEIEAKLEATKRGIADLPAKLEGNPIAIIWKLLATFKKDVSQLVAGRPEDGIRGLIQKFRGSKKVFQEAIFKQAPDFRPYTLYEEEAHEPVEFRNGDMLSDEGRERLEPGGPVNPSLVVYLDEVLDMADNAITRELPYNYPYDVKKHYVARFTEKWPVPAKQLFDKHEREFLSELKVLVTKHFSAFAAGGLERTVMRTVLTQLKVCSAKAEEKVKDCIALEREEPSTANEDSLADYKEKFTGRYKAARRTRIRHDSKLQSFVDGRFHNSSTMQTTISNLASMGFENVTKDALLRLIPSDRADTGIEIMAEVRAYYQVAFKRFVDYIPMIIDYQLLKAFDRTLDDALFVGLSLGEPEPHERCQQFLQEDPAIVRRRKSLQQDLERFEAASIELQNIPGLSLSGSASDDE